MKYTLYTLLFSIICFLPNVLSAQITYVNASATGTADGSSWENAFTTLDDALDKFNGTSVLTQEEIWVASGTYKPGKDMADTSSTFFLNAPVDLYGGFAGTENDRSERDPTGLATVLSGDLAGDDNGMIDSLSRLDNSRHVLLFDGSISRKITVDGFTITGGHTSDNGDADFIQRAGGGILSFTALDVSNCIFTNNYGRSGGGIAFDSGDLVDGSITDMVTVTDCTFDSNLSDSQSAGLVMYFVNDAEISNCTFTNNITNRGCCYPNNCVNVTIQDCMFENNNNPDGFGGGMFVWQTSNLQLINNAYIGNEANSAGGMYFDARNIINDDMQLLIKDCVFTENEARSGTGGGLFIFQGKDVVIEDCEYSLNQAVTAGGFYYSGSTSPRSDKSSVIFRNTEFRTNQALDGQGGAFRTFQGSYSLEDCTFLGNVSAGTNSGGAIFSNGNDKVVEIDKCFFGTNASNWGAGIAIYGDSTDAVVKNSTFLSNAADSRGGAIYGGFQSTLAVDSCEFRTNIAASGGAISSQNDTTTITITNSEFTQNTVTGNGGAISINDGANFTISECTLFQNEGNFGGAIAFNADDNPRIDTARFLIQNCIIENNMAIAQGGAININDMNGRIENSLIHSNTADGPGVGGAISHNVSDSMALEINLDIVNSSIVNNLGVLSSGIAAFTDLEGFGNINIQNTLLYNIKDFAIEAGVPTLTSLGGNFSRDGDLIDILGDDDILQPDPLFVDLANNNFRLAEGSPCVDAGIPGVAPERDIEGYLRDNMPDIGCYEQVLNSSVSSIENISANIWPNPTTDYINVDLNLTEVRNVLIYNVEGQLVRQEKSDWNNIDVSDMETGIYYLYILADKTYRAGFVKK